MKHKIKNLILTPTIKNITKPNDNIINPVPRSGCLRIIKNGRTIRRIGKIINKCSLNV